MSLSFANAQSGLRSTSSHVTNSQPQAMIEDLKADSARWDSERRAQTSRNTAGGIHASRDASGVPARHSSNSPAVQYRYSETHQSRQHHGPTDSTYQADPYSRDAYDSGPRYPGTGAPGYTGAAGSYAAQSAYPTSGGAFAYTQQSPPPQDPRYGTTPTAGSVLNQGYQSAQDTYIATNANSAQRGYAAAQDPYSNRSASAAQQAAYAAATTQAGYPATTAAYQYAAQTVPTAGSTYPTMQQPQDPFYGRGAYKLRC